MLRDFFRNLLVDKIANLHNVKPEQVTLGAGSVEILRMAAEAFLTEGEKLVLASPTFDAMARFEARSGTRVKRFENGPLGVGEVHALDLRHWP